MGAILGWIVAPGFFDNGPVQSALIVGGVVAIVTATIGLFTVLRGQSFAGHALSDVGAAGGSGAALAGVSPLLGFVVAAIGGAGVMEGLGIRRERGRDLATGIVLGAALGLAALFLYWDTTVSSTTGATQSILFGSLFLVSADSIPAILVLSVLALGIVAALYRPLLLTTLSPEMASARGVDPRQVGILYLVALAGAVAMSCLAIGAILSTALLIGPAASAIRLTKSPGRAALASAFIGLLATWLGILLAYDSYTWPPAGQGWPVSFFVVALVFLVYLLASALGWLRTRVQRAARTSPAPGATAHQH